MTFEENYNKLPTDFFNPNYENILLKQIKISVQKLISRHTLVNMRVNIFEDLFNDMIVTSLTSWVMTESLKEKTFNFTHKKPKNSWQLFKQERFPKWLLKGFPIEYKIIKEKVTFEAYEVYPQLPKVYNVGHHFTEIKVRK